MRSVQVHFQESEVSHKDFLSTKTFLSKAYLNDISKKFPEENFEIILKIVKYLYGCVNELKPKKG